MAEAGSVAPVFRDGGYDATATYDFYHAIIYNNKLYFCRQDNTIGHEPQEESDEYWFLSLDGNIVDASTLNGKTESELVVADSAKLGGRGASEYALDAKLANYLSKNGSGTITGTVAHLDFVDNDYPLIGRVGVFGNGARLQKLDREGNVLAFLVVDDSLGIDDIARVSNDKEIYSLIHAGNVGKHALPKNGGTVGNGTEYTPLKVNGVADGSYIEFEGNGNRYGRLGFYGESKLGMLDNNSNLYQLLHTGNVGDYAIPKSGGVLNDYLQINTERDTPFVIARTNASYAEVYNKYYVNGAELGGFGYYGANNPVYVRNDGYMYPLLHSGNKPSGTYTGTGSEQGINTSGIGNAILIWYMNGSAKCMLLVTPYGAFGSHTNGPVQDIFFQDGHISMSNTSVANMAGVTYNWQVL